MDLCFGDNYYNDTRIGVHQKVWTGEPTDYRGRLVIDDPSGTNVVLPTARNSLCGDRGCKVPLYYSTDSGKTFKRMVYMNNSFDPSRDSEGYMIAATKDALYIARSNLALPLSDRLDSRKRRNLILRIICHRNIFFPVSKWEMSHTSDKIASDIYWVFHDASL
jgi:hypothetical protein